MILTGIGSQQTPLDIQEAMVKIASFLASKGFMLRSGGANGADSAFEKGFRLAKAQDRMEIYLPWPRFNDNPSPLYGVCDEAIRIAAGIHPAWPRCGRGVRLLHGRNAYQILGKTLDKPSDIVICWTKNAQMIGGTRTALILAKQYDIPIFNLADSRVLKHIMRELDNDDKP